MRRIKPARKPRAPDRSSRARSEQPRSRGEAPRAIERVETSRSSWRRLMRTLVLATVATVFALIWIADQYGIEREVILEFLAASAAFVLLLIAAGLGGAVLLWSVKKLTQRNSSSPPDVTD